MTLLLLLLLLSREVSPYIPKTSSLNACHPAVSLENSVNQKSLPTTLAGDVCDGELITVIR